MSGFSESHYSVEKNSLNETCLHRVLAFMLHFAAKKRVFAVNGLEKIDLHCVLVDFAGKLVPELDTISQLGRL